MLRIQIVFILVTVAALSFGDHLPNTENAEGSKEHVRKIEKKLDFYESLLKYGLHSNLLVRGVGFSAESLKDAAETLNTEIAHNRNVVNALGGRKTTPVPDLPSNQKFKDSLKAFQVLSTDFLKFHRNESDAHNFFSSDKKEDRARALELGYFLAVYIDEKNRSTHEDFPNNKGDAQLMGLVDAYLDQNGLSKNGEKRNQLFAAAKAMKHLRGEIAAALDFASIPSINLGDKKGNKGLVLATLGIVEDDTLAPENLKKDLSNSTLIDRAWPVLVEVEAQIRDLRSRYED